MISGPSGRGKSTLFRTIAGIWPFATGSIESPLTCAMPQKAFPHWHYLMLCYPYQMTVEEIIAALEKYNSHLVSEIDDNQDWIDLSVVSNDYHVLMILQSLIVCMDEPAAA